MTDTNINEPPQRTFATHLIAEELWAWTYADRKIKDDRLALTRTFRIKRQFIFCLQAVEHADDGLLDDDSKIDLDLICSGHPN